MEQVLDARRFSTGTQLFEILKETLINFNKKIGFNIVDLLSLTS